MVQDDDEPERGPKQQPGKGATRPEGQGSAATNGYWIHDEAGPKEYVAALPEAVPADADGPAERFAAGLFGLRGLTGLDVRLVAAENGWQVEGQVDSEADLQAVQKLAQKVAAGQPIVSHVRVLKP